MKPTFAQILLRWLSRETEEQRMVFRMAIHCAQANAEDLTKTASKVVTKLSTDRRNKSEDRN